MYLKRLEIQGFKSFATKTILDFVPPHDGRFSITAVVGPNGSGKSNITDAIRWVMGETSLKALRGKKSEDVIFGGSQSKGQLSAAEVTMVLDNADNKLDLDFPEISITRRLYRNGEGEYLVNNNTVRMLDIHLLLARAQFAQHSYGVVSQGMIDRLLIVGPQERKDFLDEAAGIKEYQIKQHQAALKLARTRENMEQASRLIAEVEPRLKLLSRQVKKLEKRQEVEINLREEQEKYYCTLYKTHLGEITAVNEKLKVVDTDYRRAFYELETLQTELAGLAHAQSRQEAFTILQTKHQEIVREKNDWERQLVIIDGRMQMQYQESGHGNIGWMENKLQELKVKHTEILDQLKLVDAESDRIEKQAGLIRAKIEKLVVAKTETAVKISRLQSALMQNQSEQSFFQFAGLTTVKAVLEAKNNFGGKTHGLVAELGQASDDYHLALDVAAGASLSSIVVEDDETGKRAIEYLRANKLGVATFLPLNKILGRPVGRDVTDALGQDGVIGLAIDLVKFSDKYQGIFSHIFGDTLVVRDISVAQRLGIGRFRMVTLEGDLVERRGVMKGGWRGRERGLSFSTRLSLSGDERVREFQAQIADEQQGLAELERTLDKARAELMTQEVETQSVRHRSSLQALERQNAEKEIAGLEKELAMVKISPAEYGALMVQLSKEKGLLEKQLAATQTRANQAAEEIARFNQAEEEKKQRVFALQESMQKKQVEVNNFLNSRNDLKIEAAKLETKQEDLNNEAQTELGAALSSVIERNPTTVDIAQIADVADKIQKLKYQLSLIGGIDEDVSAEYTTTKERYDFLSGQISDLGAAVGDLEKMIEELDDIMKKKRAVAFKKIRKEFDRYFKILFGGGTADLLELYGPEPDDSEVALAPTPLSLPSGMGDGELPPLTKGRIGGVAEDVNGPTKKKSEVLYGVDIVANPPGKKIKNLSALSGGERTLTSIALICAILNNNPSPFVVLDEVEAALDEANTSRFVKIMSELSTHSQFVVITHNRVTMHAADALYGVTMGGDGVSKLLSVKLEQAERIDKNE